MKEYIAVDLGASNGRTILGSFDGSSLSLGELNRFENNYIRVGDAYYWDILRLFSSIKEGLVQYAKKHDGEIAGIGIDTWGVDFGLLDRKGRLVGNPYSYRDPRGARGQQAFHNKYGERAAFDITGIANMELNSIYQLYDMVQTGAPELEIADKLLLIPDLLEYMLSGEVSTEYTNATTTQMLDNRTGNWSGEILEMLGLPGSLFTAIQMSGEAKGELLSYIQQETGLKTKPKLYCVGSHDTASAVASVPAETDRFAFISSGTWSLMGIVSGAAIINDKAYGERFSNEGTISGAYRPLKNIMGLWIIQNCKRQWDREQVCSWDDLVRVAEQAPAYRSFIDVNAHAFFDGDSMPQKIQSYCKQTGQQVPQTRGEITRVVYESLAMSYRQTFIGLEELRGGRIDVLHIVGGGSKNSLLNQFTANAINREVIAGPAEATAIGNLLVQMEAAGDIKGQKEMLQVIRNSFDVQSFAPQNASEWDEQYERYLKITRR